MIVKNILLLENFKFLRKESNLAAENPTFKRWIIYEDINAKKNDRETHKTNPKKNQHYVKNANSNANGKRKKHRKSK